MLRRFEHIRDFHVKLDNVKVKGAKLSCQLNTQKNYSIVVVISQKYVTIDLRIVLCYCLLVAHLLLFFKVFFNRVKVSSMGKVEKKKKKITSKLNIISPSLFYFIYVIRIFCIF